MMKVLSAIWYSPWLWTLILANNVIWLVQPNQSVSSIVWYALCIAFCVKIIIDESIQKFSQRMFDSEDES